MNFILNAATETKKICVFGQRIQDCAVSLCRFAGKSDQEEIHREDICYWHRSFGHSATEILPPVEACDLLSYLVLETSSYTKDLFKIFWSLLAYSHMVSGPITGVFGQIVREKYVVLAKVRHSQRMNDPRMQLWVITTKQGSVVLGHCVGCMAGLGECRSHIASVLFTSKSGRE